MWNPRSVTGHLDTLLMRWVTDADARSRHLNEFKTDILMLVTSFNVLPAGSHHVSVTSR